MTESADVPPEIVARLRWVCLGLPDAYEELAWVGTRWRIRKRTFAHVLTVASGWPPAYARAAAANGPIIVMTFRSSDPELDVLGSAGHPFFRPEWVPTVVGMVLDADVDWDEVAELILESYCVLAPKKPVELVDRPTLSVGIWGVIHPSTTIPGTFHPRARSGPSSPIRRRLSPVISGHSLGRSTLWQRGGSPICARQAPRPARALRRRGRTA